MRKYSIYFDKYTLAQRNTVLFSEVFNFFPLAFDGIIDFAKVTLLLVIFHHM